ncbi:hypothetical protein JD844_020173 [Phrynosoma platyrhinos]|uniref:Inactive rhomboid protein n=1 Tax=Phrynosoma platyrhinos TaxID=52577 RepID=A0ABQ7TQM7_PHRPL|nr:hypothetical protein JD844_020173 [Phrynosoma platyrhinos]
MPSGQHWSGKLSFALRARPRSFTPASFLEEDTVDFPDELDTSFFAREGVLHEEFSTYPDEVFESPSEAAIREMDVKIQLDQPALTGGALDRNELERSHLMLPLERGWRKQKEGSMLQMQPKVRLRQEVVSLGLQRRGQRITVPVRKLFAKEKRPYGLGMVGRLTNRTYRKRIDSFVKQQIEDMDDHRPFFTYWVTFVHSLITILAVSIYGIAPVGFSQHETVDSVLRNRGVYENVKYVQQENFWIGPSSVSVFARFHPAEALEEWGEDARAALTGMFLHHQALHPGCPPRGATIGTVLATVPLRLAMALLSLSQEALIHLGAKFAPCMRQDQQVHSFIIAAREREKHSACCVRNDKSGCLQTAEEECSVSARHLPLRDPSQRCLGRVQDLHCLGITPSGGTALPVPLTMPLSSAVHLSCVGEVATPPQCPPTGRRQATVWISVSSGPQGRQLKRKDVGGPPGQHKQPPAEEAPWSQAGHPPPDLPEGRRGYGGAGLGTAILSNFSVSGKAELKGAAKSEGPQDPQRVWWASDPLLTWPQGFDLPSGFLWQPPRRQAFLRSVSMPTENTRLPSPHHEGRRLGLQRQTSITRTIRRQVHFERTQTLPIHGRQTCVAGILVELISAVEGLTKGLFGSSALLLRGTADWFGISKENDATQKWQRKTLRHCSLRYGKLKPQVIREMDLPREGAAVLLRSLEPLQGLETMRQRRQQHLARRKGPARPLKDWQLCNGPSKLCQALAVDKSLDQEDLACHPAVWLEASPGATGQEALVCTTRIGISGDWAQKPLRFYLRGNKCVSVADRRAEEAADHQTPG